MRVTLTLSLLFMIISSSAHAEIYKCEAGKGKTVYSDKPCQAENGQSTLNITTPTVQTNKTLVMKQLGDAVKSAINNNDLDRAEALATTDEQKGWVAKARSEAAKVSAPKTEAEINAEKASSEECITAQKDLDQFTNDNNPDPSTIGAKTSLMRVKCGLKEPDSIIYNQIPYYPYRPITNHHHDHNHDPQNTHEQK